jgi:hypothetical protein
LELLEGRPDDAETEALLLEEILRTEGLDVLAARCRLVAALACLARGDLVAARRQSELAAAGAAASGDLLLDLEVRILTARLDEDTDVLRQVIADATTAGYAGVEREARRALSELVESRDE